ncbi:PTS transporter subunit EIIC [Clostridium botulinum C]|uniref:PTS glucose transporter subunit IIA n=3 Tax=Clostridium botulinum TaxID=1491 RepID=A0A9Q4TQD7_CLOBO|nr:glucose PTS transporter subunit IIA [Clostridium botulinum]MCD3195628.1 PTS transporter subunit EIIC [Clostridium botulinum C]MCD3201043.1 PTS transporter subunit EIIC [Clostridium botulinum C]MCD3206452.1 PTS transporter subunit EIIC [Clostridium botulinum C]MCD3208990.1 PTS transporter subunit EIIC [Clostridium botulinum C]MCD3225754.1 PTS transporter subunit EIIC [Clostridium botulinum C]
MKSKNNKGKIFGTLQKIGKSLMLPVSVLPAAGLLLRLGQDDLLGQLGPIFQNIAKAGDAIFSGLPLIFAVGVAIGFSGGEGVAALAAAIGHLILQSVLKATGQRLDMAIDMGVFGGIMIGLIAATLYNKFHNIKLPQVLGFFGGKRFVPIITSVASLIFSIIGGEVWPLFQDKINIFAHWATSSILGPAFYASGKRLLIPLGLHHIYYPSFLYQFGEFTSKGIKYFGDTARYFHGDPTAGFFMAAEYPILMFGLPAAALAMILASKKENRKKMSGMMISAAFVAFLTGITEPIEFSFIFVAPILFVFHVAAAFLSGIITSFLHIRLGYTFSASFIDYILGFKFAGHPWLIWLVGLAFFALYFVVFYFTIKLFNIHTPGREEEDSSSPKFDNIQGTEKAKRVLLAIGGKNNIEVLDACITRLRLTLKDPSIVDKSTLKALGAAGIFESGNNVQAIFGTQAEIIKDEIKSIIESGEDISLDNIDSIEEIHSSSNTEIQDNVVPDGSLDSQILLSPVSGKIMDLSEVPDDTFASKLMGDGIAIDPTDGIVTSPVDGTVAQLFWTNHALGIITDSGVELLIHVGIDTVQMEGRGFKAFVSQGDKVKAGDKLLEVDLDLVRKEAKSAITPIIITNSAQLKSIEILKDGDIKNKENILKVNL